jgi:integrase
MSNNVTHSAKPTRTGTLEVRRGGFVGRLRLGNGRKSPRFPLEAKTKAQARAMLAGLQAEEDSRGTVLTASLDVERERARDRGVAAPGESSDAWFARYVAGKDCGEQHKRIALSVWSKWCSPTFGAKPIALLNGPDVEDVRDVLDRAVDAGVIHGATPHKIWAIVTRAMKEAYSAKDRALRVHKTVLSFGIQPPKRMPSRKRPFLYPVEWEVLARCEAIPLARRQLYAFAIYTGLRPSEIQALTWGDVDLRAGVLSVNKAAESVTGKRKSTKTEAGHRVIELVPALVPFLESLASGASHPIIDPKVWPGRFQAGAVFRADLRKAGVDRARLFAMNASEEAADFRTCRDTCATWYALDGVSIDKVKEQLGHEDIATSLRYTKAARPFRASSIGAPFSAIPYALFGATGPRFGPKQTQPLETFVGAVGIEPTTSSV